MIVKKIHVFVNRCKLQKCLLGVTFEYGIARLSRCMLGVTQNDVFSHLEEIEYKALRRKSFLLHWSYFLLFLSSYVCILFFSINYTVGNLRHF